VDGDFGVCEALGFARFGRFGFGCFLLGVALSALLGID